MKHLKYSEVKNKWPASGKHINLMVLEGAKFSVYKHLIEFNCIIKKYK